MDNKLPNTLVSFIWFFVKPYKLIATLFVFLAIIAGFWGPFNSMLIKHIIDALPYAKDGDISTLILPAILVVLNFIIFDNVAWRSIQYIIYKYAPEIKNNITKALFDHVLGLHYQFFQDNLSGRISNQITILSDNIEKILYPIIPNLLRGTSLVIIAMISSYFVNPLFFVIILSWLVTFVSFSIFMSKKIVGLADSYAKEESNVSGQLVDTITNSHNIRIFSQKNHEISRMDLFLLKRFQAFRKEEMMIIIICIMQGALIATMLGAVLYLLTTLYAKHLVFVGDFALILGLTMEAGHMIWWTMSCVDDFNKAVGKCKQSLNSLIIPLTIEDPKDAVDLIVKKGEITFDNVDFHYKDTDLLFKNKSIKIEAGQKVGLVGYSGSGKSTFVNLILRLYDVTQDSILIDGQDIRKVKQDSLRESVAIIPQDPSLFHRSLAENLSYGKIESTQDEIIRASLKAHSDEFISKLPDKYDSLVGERGIKLSGGERQRIAIARAILKNSPILILDEATSQLDSVTEIYIQESLSHLMKDKTTIVVAHRLSTLLNMDRILVFDKGKIVQDGSHYELLQKGGLYKTLWDTQVGGFLPEKKT